jgi:hypothetical protein
MLILLVLQSQVLLNFGLNNISIYLRWRRRFELTLRAGEQVSESTSSGIPQFFNPGISGGRVIRLNISSSSSSGSGSLGPGGVSLFEGSGAVFSISLVSGRGAGFSFDIAVESLTVGDDLLGLLAVVLAFTLGISGASRFPITTISPPHQLNPPQSNTRLTYCSFNTISQPLPIPAIFNIAIKPKSHISKKRIKKEKKGARRDFVFPVNEESEDLRKVLLVEARV